MKIETNICTKQIDNPYMGILCYSGPNRIFFFDKNNWVKIGDQVKIERDEYGFYHRIWVNGILKTNDYFSDTQEQYLKTRGE